MKRKTLISIPLVLAIIISLFGGFATGASATTVTDMSEFIVQSATPTSLGRWNGGSGYTYTETDGANSSRTIAYSGTSTSSHVSLYIPQSAVNENASAKPYILHLSYRIQNDRTNPAYITHRMQYKSSSGTGLYNDIFDADTSQFTMNLDATKNITSFGTSNYNYLDPYDYKFDLYENLKTGAYQIYLNGVKWTSAYDYASDAGAYTTLFSGSGNGAYTINEYRIRVTGAANSSWAFNLVNPCYEIYSEDVMMDEVVAYSLSGMSNYLYETGPSDTASSTINSTSGTITLSPAKGTASDSYSATGVSSGAQLIWWSGTESSGTGHKPKFGSYTVSGKEWYHMGFNITGTDVGLKLICQCGNGSGSSVGNKDIISAHTGSNYRVDYVFDLANQKAYVYYNNVFDSVQSVNYNQFRQIKLTTTTATDFTISNISFKYYATGVDPGDILIGYDERTKETYDYVYQIDGIKSGTNVIGSTDGLCSVTGDNTDGYTIRPTSLDKENRGFARFYLGYTAYTGIFQRDTDRVLHQTFYYKPAAVSTEQTIGMRGGTSSTSNGYKYFLFANPSTGDFEDTDRNRIKSYDTNTFYKIDIIVNCCDFKYYFLLDGICIESGTLYFQPIWQIVYTSRSTSDYMVIKNMQTTLYKDNYTLLDKVKPLLTRIYANLESCSVSDGTATVTTSFIGNTSNESDSNTKVIYGVYNSAGALLKYQAVNSANTYVNGSNLSTAVTIPSGGTTLKVFMWNMDLSGGTLTPIANVITKSLQ